MLGIRRKSSPLALFVFSMEFFLVLNGKYILARGVTDEQEMREGGCSVSGTMRSRDDCRERLQRHLCQMARQIEKKMVKRWMNHTVQL